MKDMFYNISHEKSTIFLTRLVIVMVVFLWGGSAHAAKASFDPAPVAKGTIEGEVIEVEEDTLVIKKLNGEEARVRIPGRTDDKAETYSVGDRVEVYVTPEGTTTSVREIPVLDGFIR